MASSAVKCYDLTIPHQEGRRAEFEDWLKQLFKKYQYQGEIGTETGFKHWQVRGHLFDRTRPKAMQTKMKDWNGHSSPTSTHNLNNWAYVSKEKTRFEGPWQSWEEDEEIPEDLRMEPEWFAWQADFHRINLTTADRRTINVIYDPEGDLGKSTVGLWSEAHGKVNLIPPCSDIKDASRWLMGTPWCRAVVLDLPRSMPKYNLGAMYAMVESIKTGRVWDDRYHIRKKILKAFHLWIFTNKLPDKNLLTYKRWNVMVIRDTGLVKVAL